MAEPPKPPPGPSGPFAALAALRDRVPAGDAPPAQAPREGAPRGPARAVVRWERRRRGGKQATIIERLGLPADALEEWCGELKRTLGCGGAVDGDAIVLQGDLRARVGPLLTERGVRKVTIA